MNKLVSGYFLFMIPVLGFFMGTDAYILGTLSMKKIFVNDILNKTFAITGILFNVLCLTFCFMISIITGIML